MTRTRTPRSFAARIALAIGRESISCTAIARLCFASSMKSRMPRHQCPPGTRSPVAVAGRSYAGDTMTSRIVISGPATWNRIVYLDQLPEPVPHMQFALEDYETVGGTSAGKALGLTALGRPVLLHTLIGDDADGALVRRALEASGVHLAELPADRTERHLNLMTRAGERVSLYLSTAGDPGTPPSRELEQAMADAPAIVLDLSERSRGLIAAARAAGRPIWTDIHDYDGNAEFHRPFIEACVRGGASVVVCTRGARGAIAVDERMRRTEVAAVPVEVLDTNGAGDG